MGTICNNKTFYRPFQVELSSNEFYETFKTLYTDLYATRLLISKIRIYTSTWCHTHLLIVGWQLTENTWFVRRFIRNPYSSILCLGSEFLSIPFSVLRPLTIVPASRQLFLLLFPGTYFLRCFYSLTPSLTTPLSYSYPLPHNSPLIDCPPSFTRFQTFIRPTPCPSLNTLISNTHVSLDYDLPS